MHDLNNIATYWLRSTTTASKRTSMSKLDHAVVYFHPFKQMLEFSFCYDNNKMEMSFACMI